MMNPAEESFQTIKYYQDRKKNVLKLYREYQTRVVYSYIHDRIVEHHGDSRMDYYSEVRFNLKDIQEATGFSRDVVKRRVVILMANGVIMFRRLPNMRKKRRYKGKEYVERESFFSIPVRDDLIPKYAKILSDTALFIREVYIELEGEYFGVNNIVEFAARLPINKRLAKRKLKSKNGQHQALSEYLTSLEGEYFDDLRIEYVGLEPRTYVKLWRVVSNDVPPIFVAPPTSKTLDQHLEAFLRGWVQANPQYRISASELATAYAESPGGQKISLTRLGTVAKVVLGNSVVVRSGARTERVYKATGVVLQVAEEGAEEPVTLSVGGSTLQDKVPDLSVDQDVTGCRGGRSIVYYYTDHHLLPST